MLDENAPYVAIWDIETQKKIQDMPGKFREDKIKLLEISCASIVKIPSALCVSPDDRQRAMELSTTKTYWIDGERDASIQHMCDVLVDAELIVGYNLAGFDWLASKKYFSSLELYERCTAKTLDVFSRVRDATGKWYKLDTLLELNNLETKTADGLQAIAWWKNGQRDVLREYCEVDTQQCARLSLLPKLQLSSNATLPNYNFGVASALASIRASQSISSSHQG